MATGKPEGSELVVEETEEVSRDRVGGDEEVEEVVVDTALDDERVVVVVTVTVPGALEVEGVLEVEDMGLTTVIVMGPVSEPLTI